MQSHLLSRHPQPCEFLMSAKILVLSGSSRAGSVNTMLATLAAARLKAAGASVTQVSLADFPLPMVDASGFGKPPAEATRFRELIDAHQGLFITSPEYNAGYAPALKNALDWATVAKPGAPATGLAGKVVALGGASPGAMGGYRGLTQLRIVLELGMGALLIPEMVVVGNTGTVFAADGSLTDERSSGFLDQVVARLIRTIDKLA
jgi:chromate reductase, NAD(P)H dehydrogenase (quinone)